MALGIEFDEDAAVNGTASVQRNCTRPGLRVGLLLAWVQDFIDFLSGGCYSPRKSFPIKSEISEHV